MNFKTFTNLKPHQYGIIECRNVAIAFDNYYIEYGMNFQTIYIIAHSLARLELLYVETQTNLVLEQWTVH